MNTGKLNDWLQVVGLFALVGSLIFVGLQMRQTQEIALSQAYQARTDQAIAIALAALENDTTLSFWTKAYGMVDEDFTPAELVLGKHFKRIFNDAMRGFPCLDDKNNLPYQACKDLCFGRR